MAYDLNTSNSSRAPFSGVKLTVMAPSRQWVTETGEVDLALHEKARAALDALGFSVTTLEGVYKEDRRFAGTDAERAADWMRALTEVEADMVIALRGGWGAARILPLLDWGKLAGTPEGEDVASRKEIPLVGFSDFTAINLAMLAKTNRVTWQGPTLKDLIEPTELTLEGLQMALGRRPWEVTWQDATGYGAKEALEIEGPLWGGNLTVLASLIGTPYFPKKEQIAGGILFLEEVGEAAYRIDRFLMQLALTGILSQTRAIVLGHCTGADRACGWEGDFSLRDALADSVARTGVPIITGLPFGHTHSKVSLPVGARVRLMREGERVALRLANEEPRHV